jgi:predicted GNAT superfamily acetyltransferase
MSQIAPLATLDRGALLALNNAHATELSWLTPGQLDDLLRRATVALGVAPMRAALIAFDQDSGYGGVHFAWFRERHPRFLYVDRVVVAAGARGQGLARLLYERVLAEAAARASAIIACEVNEVPPNPASDAFHARLGFRPVGRATAPEGGKTVRYLIRPVA